MKPIITTHDASTGIETQREMTDEEIAEIETQADLDEQSAPHD